MTLSPLDAQIEGYRTDVVINTSLLATDWYIDQMKKTYESDPILTDDSFALCHGIRDYIKHESLWILLGGTLKTL